MSCCRLWNIFKLYIFYLDETNLQGQKYKAILQPYIVLVFYLNTKKFNTCLPWKKYVMSSIMRLILAFSER